MRQRVSTSGLAIALVMALSLILGACTSGHDTSDDGNGNTNDSTTSGPSASSATRLDLIASSPTLDSSAIDGANGVTLTAIVRDADNNAVANPEVAFQTDNGRIVAGGRGDATGTATATLYNDPDRADRDIAVSATLGHLSDSQIISATGTTLSLSGPASVAPGDHATFNVLMHDSNGNPIAGAPVAVSPAASITPSDGTLDTDDSGELRFIFSSDKRQSIDVTVKARGATDTKSISVGGNALAFVGPDDTAEAGHEITLSVRDLDDVGRPVAGQTINFSASRGDLSAESATTDSTGMASIRLTSTVTGDTNVVASTNDRQTAQRISVTAADPAALVLNASPTTLAPRDTSQLTAALFDQYSNPVTDRDVDFNLAASSPGSLSESRVATDDAGAASTTYTAGPASTSDDIRVAASAVEDAAISGTATLRVAGKPLAITLGTGGAPMLSSDGTTYSAPYAVLVTDAAGNPVDSADLRLRVRALSYQAADQDQPLCLNEDTNNDGILEASEDRNKNDQLEPGPVASVPSAPGLDDSGTARFDVTYLSRYANLVKVRLTATASVAGSQSSQAIDFDLKGSSSSDADPFPAACSASER